MFTLVQHKTAWSACGALDGRDGLTADMTSWELLVRSLGCFRAEIAEREP
jgi:hypothetical protein